MKDDFIKRAVENALTSYAAMKRRQVALRRQIVENDRERARMTLQIVSLARLCGDIPDDSPLGKVLKQVAEMGLTESVTSVLQASDKPLAATDVRDSLIRLGYDVSRYQNAVAAITTVLGRMDNVQVSSDEESKKTFYKWQPPKDEEEMIYGQFDGLPPKQRKKLLNEMARTMTMSAAPKNAVAEPKARKARKK